MGGGRLFFIYNTPLISGIRRFVMKKTLKVLGLLAVAAALFIGCKNNADEGSGEKNIQEDLFDATELTETATTYEFTDGEWTYRHIVERDDMIDATQIEFTVKDKDLDLSKSVTYIMLQKGTMPDEATDAQIAAAKKQGYKVDGKEYSLYREYDLVALNEKANKDADFAKKIEDAMSKESNEAPDPEVMAYIQGMMYLMALEPGHSVPSGTKTNSEKSKYYCFEEENSSKHGKITEKTYIAKK